MKDIQYTTGINPQLNLIQTRESDQSMKKRINRFRRFQRQKIYSLSYGGGSECLTKLSRTETGLHDNSSSLSVFTLKPPRLGLVSTQGKGRGLIPLEQKFSVYHEHIRCTINNQSIKCRTTTQGSDPVREAWTLKGSLKQEVWT